MNLALTAVTADWLFTMLGYGLLVLSARLCWLGLRGWHVLAKEDVAMVDFVAVFLPWSAVAIAAGQPFMIDPPWQQWLALSGLVWLAVWLWVVSATGLGLRMRALGLDPAGLTRLGVNTRSLSWQLGVASLTTLALAGPLLALQATSDPLGYWTVAGVALVLLGGRLFPVLIVISAIVTGGILLKEHSGAVPPFALASCAVLALLLCARRWREPDFVVHID